MFIEPTYPKDRITFMLEDCDPAIVVTTSRFVDDLGKYTDRCLCLDTEWESIGNNSVRNLREQ